MSFHANIPQGKPQSKRSEPPKSHLRGNSRSYDVAIAARQLLKFFNKFIWAHLRVPRSQKIKASSRREQAAHIFFALYQIYVTVRDQVLGSTPLLFKYCPVVLEVKIEEPRYPLHRLYPSTAVLLYSQKNSAESSTQKRCVRMVCNL